MTNNLRQRILAALCEDGLTLTELHAKVAGDSRAILAELHAMAAEKLAVCGKEDGRVIWSLTDDAEVDPDAAPAPEPPQVRRVEPQPVEHKPKQSVPVRVLAYLHTQNEPRSSGEIIAALTALDYVEPNSVYMALNFHRKNGSVERLGDGKGSKYRIATAPRAELAPAPRPAGEVEVDMPPARSRSQLVAINIRVPLDRARAVLAAIEGALAA